MQVQIGRWRGPAATSVRNLKNQSCFSYLLYFNHFPNSVIPKDHFAAQQSLSNDSKYELWGKPGRAA
jgi:hypothetical protein